MLFSKLRVLLFLITYHSGARAKFFSENLFSHCASSSFITLMPFMYYFKKNFGSQKRRHGTNQLPFFLGFQACGQVRDHFVLVVFVLHKEHMSNFVLTSYNQVYHPFPLQEALLQGFETPLNVQYVQQMSRPNAPLVLCTLLCFLCVLPLRKSLVLLNSTILQHLCPLQRASARGKQGAILRRGARLKPDPSLYLT